MKAVIFDIGKVLVHYDPAPILAALAEISAANPDDIQAALAAIRIPLNTGEMDARRMHRYLIGRCGASADWDSFYAAACHSLARREAPLGFVKQLAGKPGLKLGIISNTNDIHALWLHENLPEFRLMDAVILSPEVGLTKPDPAIYRLALERLALEPAQAFFLDDLEKNVTAAQELGMAALIHEDWDASRSRIESWLAAAGSDD